MLSYADLKTAIQSDSTLNSMVSTRVFQKKPIQQQTLAYITMKFYNEDVNDVRFRTYVQFYCFSKNMNDTVLMTRRLIDVLSGNTTLSSTTYNVTVLGMRDSDKQLSNGFYYAMLDILVHHIR